MNQRLLVEAGLNHHVKQRERNKKGPKLLRNITEFLCDYLESIFCITQAVLKKVILNISLLQENHWFLYLLTWVPYY